MKHSKNLQKHRGKKHSEKHTTFQRKKRRKRQHGETFETRKKKLPLYTGKKKEKECISIYEN
jgi:hypothetical protein